MDRQYKSINVYYYCHNYPDYYTWGVKVIINTICKVLIQA